VCSRSGNRLFLDHIPSVVVVAVVVAIVIVKVVVGGDLVLLYLVAGSCTVKEDDVG